jgi:diacylglycerol kinase (ATP)
VTPHRSLVIVNPAASRIHDAQVRHRLVERVRATSWLVGAEAVVVTERNPFVIQDAVRGALAGGVDRVVAVGGDGTVVAVASAMAASGITLAIVPAGTGNILAGTLGIRGGASAMRSLRDGVVRDIDLGRASWAGGRVGGVVHPAGERPFAVGCGAGFDARVMATTPTGQKRLMGRGSYFAAALRAVLRVRNAAYRVELDGRVVETEAAVALVANAGELIPGLVRPRLPIVPDDGLLELIVVRASGPFQGIRGVVAALATTTLSAVPRGLAWRARAERIRISTFPAEPVEIDGDVVGLGSLDATVERGALRLLVPASAAARSRVELTCAR